MTTRKRKRSDTIQSMLDMSSTLQDGAISLSWRDDLVPRNPDPVLADRELKIYEACLPSRFKGDWTPASLIDLARYAGHAASLIQSEDMLRATGDLIPSPNNPAQRVRNPLIDTVSTRQAIVDKLGARLGLFVTDPRSVARAASASSAIEGAFKKADSNSLLA
jgi:hypothetical protein